VPGPAEALTWTATVTADRAYFDGVISGGHVEAASITFPEDCPPRRFELTGAQMRIGRRSVSRGLTPEIDLSGPPLDPGISHLHALLVARDDGTWSVQDTGSSNGTQVNGDEIAVGVPVVLADGDRICLGAWTVVTVQAS
jgi:pSer/pThr/pTyr-binding forkhead associated (FHA) protein